MQHGGVTNTFSLMHGSTSNPINPLQTVVDDHSSHSGNEYINLDDDTGATNNTNGDTSGKDTEKILIVTLSYLHIDFKLTIRLEVQLCIYLWNLIFDPSY